MTYHTGTDLDTFETALLDELKAELPTVRSAPMQTRRPVLRPRWFLTAGAIGMAALAVTLLVPGLGPTPAFAVTGRNNQEVRVEVYRLEGAQGLEQALAEHGVRADVTYLPAGQECASGRYVDTSGSGMSLSISAGTFEVIIPPNAVGDDDTWVLDASVVPRPDGGVQARVSYGIGHGPIAPCKIINS